MQYAMIVPLRGLPVTKHRKDLSITSIFVVLGILTLIVLLILNWSPFSPTLLWLEMATR